MTGHTNDDNEQMIVNQSMFIKIVESIRKQLPRYVEHITSLFDAVLDSIGGWSLFVRSQIHFGLQQN